MDRVITRDVDPPRRGFRWPQLLTIVIVIAVLGALLIPWINHAREQARCNRCTNALKYIGVSLQNYHLAMRTFPPGTICSSEPISPGNQYDVWTEAGRNEVGAHGTSIFLRIMPYLTGDSIAYPWASGEYPGTTADCWSPAGNAGTKDAPCLAAAANDDSPFFYCPARRTKLRPDDKKMMLAPWWPGGGTDYGGCAGRHAAFSLKTGYNLCDASMVYEPNFYPESLSAEDDTIEKRWGIFGRVNVSTNMDEITDGTSNTIMVGELQRITDYTPGSKDGWSVGGPATLFTTGAMFRYEDGKLECTADPKLGKLMNNHFFGSPGSDHVGGAHFGLADGSVTFLSDDIDPGVFSLMGSMADGLAESPKSN